MNIADSIGAMIDRMQSVERFHRVGKLPKAIYIMLGETVMNKPQYFECGICSSWHRADWWGDCRDDRERLTVDDINARHGDLGWEEVDQEDAR